MSLQSLVMVNNKGFHVKRAGNRLVVRGFELIEECLHVHDRDLPLIGIREVEELGVLLDDVRFVGVVERLHVEVVLRDATRHRARSTGS